MNPFNPGFGKKPEIFLDRQLLIQKVTDELENPNSPYRTSLIYGLRGSGKTAFLTDASTAVAAKKGWIVLNLAMSDSILPNLIVELYRKANSPLQKLFSQIKGGQYFSIRGRFFYRVIAAVADKLSDAFCRYA